MRAFGKQHSNNSHAHVTCLALIIEATILQLIVMRFVSYARYSELGIEEQENKPWPK